MKIVNKRMFIRGTVFFLLALVLLISRFFFFSENIHGLPLNTILWAGVCAAAALYHWVMAISERDEHSTADSSEEKM